MQMATDPVVQSIRTVQYPQMTASQAGKWRRLSRLADEDGRFAMIAVDQRESLKEVLKEGLSEEEVRWSLQTVKRLVAEHITPLGSALLIDPVYGYPYTLGAIPSRAGLMLAVEISGYMKVSEFERRSRLIEDFDVRLASVAGADAAKLLIWHHPDASIETQRHQQDIVRRVGNACREKGMPFVLEIVTYALGEDKSSAAFIQRKPELVLDGVRTYSAQEYGVDLLKVQFPAELKYTEEYQDEPYAKGKVLFDRAQVESLCRSVDDAASTPWVILSAGVDPNEFIENVKLANAAGASGFLCGRAVWKNVVDSLPDEDAMARFMQAYGCENFRRIREANGDALPWFRHKRYADVRVQ